MKVRHLFFGVISHSITIYKLKFNLIVLRIEEFINSAVITAERHEAINFPFLKRTLKGLPGDIAS